MDSGSPSHRVGLGRRAGTVARWPLGMVLTSWHYMWRTTPLRRLEEEGGTEDLPSPLPEAQVDRHNQPMESGVGPLYHRRFRVRIVGSSMRPDELIAALREDPNRAAPSEVAVFRKLRGPDGPLRTGDEFVVRMPGPYDGPVRVVHHDATSFRLATLHGHLEAGQIEFRAGTDDGALLFEIEAWARAADRLSHLLYRRVGIAKEIQFNMWTMFCERVCAASGGRHRGGISIHTRRVADPLCGAPGDGSGREPPGR